MTRWPLALAVVVVLAVSAALRTVQHQRIPVPERGTWITSDADSFYHMRRVERALRSGTIDGHDPALSFPEGSAIPWPPYYTAVAAVATAPFLPETEPARRDFIERRVASLPRWFGAATSAVAVLAGWLLAGPAAGLLAGLLHALSAASIVYSRVGNGDHHAWITLLAGTMLLLLSRSLRGETLLRPRAAALGGAATGAVAGLALGSWVASVLYVLPVQIVLGILVWRHAREQRAGLAALGLAFHAAAIVAVLPAVLASPWAATQPWMVVNLTWFHAAWLAVGALVFVPMFRITRPGAAARYPWMVLGALAALAAALFALDAGPAEGLRESFAWMARNDEFMGAVWESRGILGQDAVFDPFAILGHGLLALPFAWAFVAWQAWRGRGELWPWAVAVPLLVAQAARQVRFADALSLPMAVVVAVGAIALWERGWAGRRRPARGKGRRAPDARRRPGAPVAVAVVVGLALVANTRSVRWTVGALNRPDDLPGQNEQQPVLVARGMAEWLRANTPDDARAAVLASWVWGHLIEWVADRPTVA
ncbi:MAG TPA: STT3 domain-containing protein, partial [bacterium]|nr:STT3 domain-containing protein [bacterium]